MPIGVRESGATLSPAVYNGIQPDTTGDVGERFLRCGAGQGVLSDADIGPTHSVDLTDADQVQRFFVWHRDNGSVVLEFRNNSIAEFTLSYIDIYTFSLRSARIGPPETTVTDSVSGPDITTSSESCTYFSTENTLHRNIYSVSQNLDLVFIAFDFNEGTDWLFFSEIILCSGDPPSFITCDMSITTSAPHPTPPPPTTFTTSAISRSESSTNSLSVSITDTPNPTTFKSPDRNTTSIIVGVAIAVVLALVSLIAITLIIMIMRHRKAQLILDERVSQPHCVELRSMEVNSRDNLTATNSLHTDPSPHNGQQNEPHMYGSAEHGLVDDPTYYTIPWNPGAATNELMDDDFYSIVDSQKKVASAEKKEITPLTIYSHVNKPMSPPVPTKSEELQIYLDKWECLVHSQSVTSTPSAMPLNVPEAVGMGGSPHYENAETVSKQEDSAVCAQPYSHTICSNTNSAHNNEGIYCEPSDFTQGGGKNPSKNAGEHVHMYPSVYSDVTMENECFRQIVKITSANITEQREIGMGQYGKVILAVTKNLSLKDMGLNEDSNHNISVYVAVKKLRSNASKSQQEAFEKEIKFLSRLNDPNVVRLLGVCYEEPAFIMMEYVEKGDLSQFLQKYTAIAPLPKSSGEIPTSMVVKMALQIASGMKYLATKNFVHRDLACRNCLVDEKFVVKLADFGMSRNLYESHYYRIQGNTVLPIRWMATECFYGMFSEKTDVWAYGITMWELFILAKDKPYPHLTDSQVVDDAVNRGTNRWVHSRPDPCPEAVYDIMQLCWLANPKKRATFEYLHGKLQRLPHYQ